MPSAPPTEPVRRRHARLAGVLALVSVLAACTQPQLIDPGPLENTPRLGAAVFETRDGLRLPYRVWPAAAPPRAVIVALHGFNDYSGFFEDAGWYFADRGIVSYAYDQRGFGASPHAGRWFETERYLIDARDFTRLVAARYPSLPLYLLGESMGGAVAMGMLTRYEADWVSGGILSAPAVWGRDAMPWYQSGLLWLAAHTMPGLTLTGRGLGIEPSDNDDMLRALGRDPLVIKETRVDAISGLVDVMDVGLAAAADFDVPALILYGENDQIVRDGPTRMMMGRLPRDADARKVAVYENGYHMLLRDLQAETVWTDIVHWIDSPTTPLPSGAEETAKRYFASD